MTAQANQRSKEAIFLQKAKNSLHRVDAYINRSRSIASMAFRLLLFPN